MIQLLISYLSAHLKRKLEDFIERYNGKVRLIRNKEREGLIRTRTRGAEESRGEVVLFLVIKFPFNRNLIK